VFDGSKNIIERGSSDAGVNTVKLYGSLICNCATTGNFVKSSADLISPVTAVRRVTE